MQIIETGALGTRSAIVRLRRRDCALEFLDFPMLHVASPAFYAEVTKRLARCAVVVAEGVTGRSVLATAFTMTYRVIPANRRSGLVQQRIDYGALGVPVIRPDVTGKEFARSWRTLPVRDRMLVWCLLPVVLVTQLAGGRKRLLTRDIAVDDEVLDSEFAERLHSVFGGERDARLLAAVTALYETHSAERIDVGIVYGAAHVPDLVHGLSATLGYRPRTAEWITAVDCGDPARVFPPRRIG